MLNWKNLWVSPKVELVQETEDPSGQNLELVVTGMVCGL